MRFNSLEFVRQFGACITTGRLGLAEEVGKIVVSLGLLVRSFWRAIHQSNEPGAHELHAVAAIGLVFCEPGRLLPEPDADTPEGEDDQSDRTEDADPRENAFATR